MIYRRHLKINDETKAYDRKARDSQTSTNFTALASS